MSCLTDNEIARYIYHCLLVGPSTDEDIQRINNHIIFCKSCMDRQNEIMRYTLERPVIKVEKDNIVFYAYDEIISSAHMKALHNFEIDTYSIFSRFLSKEYSYVDIGSWVGSTVLYCSQLARHCYAIEPDPMAINILRANIDLNRFRNITVYSGAISDKNGSSTIGNVSRYGNSMSSLLFSTSAFPVQCMTLESFFKAYGITDCNFIKMDIEGGEYLVLPEASDFLKSFDHILCLSLHFQPFIKNLEDVDKLAECISNTYGYLYSIKGERIDSDFIIKNKTSDGISIIASRKEI